MFVIGRFSFDGILFHVSVEQTLTTIDLQSTGIDSIGAEHLANMLQINKVN